ncbi:MAG: glycoside hydrolase family 1 protein [Candidatus Moranbacteria bacterium]|nr:glycoside hydrolase family 1 protein [Candidatus Moranbacteria bacterium]
MKILKFPEKFYWGAATAAHQVEGGQHNDWSEWEKANAERLARESEKDFRWNPHWKEFEGEATNPKNYISGLACDHYNRFREDFDLAKDLGHNAHRFSIEWSRIEPEEGRFDEKAIEHYRVVLLSLRERGLEPFVTLLHFTLPLWLSKKGGVLHKDFPDCFERYTEKVAQALGEHIHYWITINEPDVFAGGAYMKGIWPPQKKNIFSFFKALRRQADAHKKAYAVIKKIFPESRVGVAKHNIWFEATDNTLVNRLLKRLADSLWNDWFLKKIVAHQDFIGLNHYHHHRITGGYNKNKNEIQTDFGWEFYPQSLGQTVMELTKYGKPIYITENGLADADDDLRPRFIREALASLHTAIQSGADVRGYLHWSLLDNFEWDKGFWPRFGLIEIDYATQKRTVRPSALAYAKICKENALELPDSASEN